MAAINVDPATGLKTFDTRAAKATDKIAGKGYSVVERRTPQGASRAPAGRQVRRRGAGEVPGVQGGPPWRGRLHGDGGRVRQVPRGRLLRADRSPREALTDECDILVVGAGFAGLLLWYKLQRRPASTTSASARRAATSAAPGTGTATPASPATSSRTATSRCWRRWSYVPTMKFASGFEILEYCQTMADEVRLLRPLPVPHHRRDAPSGTRTAGRWTVYTDRGDAMRARFVILANGILTSPKLARIDGHGDVRGRAPSTPRAGTTTSTSRASAIGIIGTGATAVQAIPELAKVAGRALRVPAHAVDDRRARPARHDPRGDRGVGERAGLGPCPPGPVRQDLRRAARRSRPTTTTSPARSPTPRSARSTRRRLSPEELMQKQLDTNFRIMEQIRARVDAIVEDPKTAAALKPYYPYGCKRPTFHDEYLPTFNRPNVTSSTPRPMGVQRDQRARRRPRRRRVPARRADLRHRLPVDGDVDVQHGRRPRRPHAEREVADGGHQDVPRPAQPRASRTCSSSPARRAAAAASTSPTPSTATATTSCGCCRRCATRGEQIVDVEAGAGGAVRRALPRRPTSPPRRCATASRTTTATATPRPAASPTTAAGHWHKWRTAGPGDDGAVRLRQRLTAHARTDDASDCSRPHGRRWLNGAAADFTFACLESVRRWRRSASRAAYTAASVRRCMPSFISRLVT